MSRGFTSFILVVIFANSIVLGVTDYSHVDQNNNVIAEGSMRNTVVANSDPVFTAIFLGECVLKIAVMGLCGSKDAYLADYWNLLDLAVVISG